jgi:hypothetical protein
MCIIIGRQRAALSASLLTFFLLLCNFVIVSICLYILEAAKRDNEDIVVAGFHVLC